MTNTSKTCGIYCFTDPLTLRTIYIGGSKDIDHRFESHKKRILEGTHEERVMKWYRQRGQLPDMNILEECRPEELTDLETSWIKLGFEERWPLLNTLEYSNCGRDKNFEKLKKRHLKLMKKNFGG